MKDSYGFFERRKRNKILSKIGEYSYSDLPWFLLNDEEVLEALLRANPEEINSVATERNVDTFLEKDNSLVKFLRDDLKGKYVYKDIKYIKHLNSEDILKIIGSTKDFNLILNLPLDVQKEIFYNPSKFGIHIEPKNIPQFFNEEIVYDFIKTNLDNAKQSGDAYKRKPGEYTGERYEKLTTKGLKISSLPIETQINIAKIDFYLIDEITNEALSKLIGDNPILYDMLPENIRENIQYKYKTIEKDFENFTIWGIEPLESKYIKIVENAQQLFIENIRKYPDKQLLENYFGNVNNIFSMWGYNNDIEPSFKDKFNQMHKVILNENIMSKCSAEEIINFLNNPYDRNRLLNLLKNSYGESAVKILEERKELTIDEILTFEIFDPKVAELFGPGITHNLLSYKNEGSYVIRDLIKNSDKMERFKKFKNLTMDFYSNDIIDIENMLNNFYDINKLFSQKISFSDIENKENFYMFLNDRYGKNGIKSNIIVETPEELNSYSEIRGKWFDEAMEYASSNYNLQREILFNKFFGTDFSRNDRIYKKGNSDIVNILRKYNIKDVLTNDKIISENLFTDYELDMLQLIQLISEIDDEETITQLYEEFSKEQDIISIMDFKEIKKKIPNIYSQALIDSLLTIDNLKENIINEEPGISYINEDGIDIFTLDGMDFRIFMHTIGLNNSGLRKGYSQIADLDIADLWKNFERGLSTISGSLIEPGLLESCNSEKKPISLGFFNINSNQILGMGYGDIHTSHDERMLNPGFDFGGPTYQFNYPEELVRKTAAQINSLFGTAKDVNHEYNEVAIYRREINPYNIKENTGGGRIMPDYIVLYGLDDQNLVESKRLAQAFQKDGIPIPIIRINLEKYKELGYNSYKRAHEGYVESVPERESEYIDSIKESVGMLK